MDRKGLSWPSPRGDFMRKARACIHRGDRHDISQHQSGWRCMAFDGVRMKGLERDCCGFRLSFDMSAPFLLRLPSSWRPTDLVDEWIAGDVEGRELAVDAKGCEGSYVGEEVVGEAQVLQSFQGLQSRQRTDVVVGQVQPGKALEDEGWSWRRGVRVAMMHRYMEP